MFDTAVFNDVVSAGCAVVIAAAAVYGLRTWREQLKGAADYELARRVLRSALKTRNAIELVRSRYIFGQETDVAVKESGKQLSTDPAKRSHQEYELVVWQRWRRVVAAASEFEAEVLESEVLWGSTIKQEGEELRAVAVKLGNAIEEHLELTRPSPSPLPDPPEDAKKRRAIVLRSVGKGAPDEYWNDVLSAIKALEEKLLPKLQRNTGDG